MAETTAIEQDTVVMQLHDDSLLQDLTHLRSDVRAHVAQGRERIVVDVAAVGRLSSATVAALLWAKRYCRARGGRIVVRGPSQDSVDMLVRAGLGEVFEIELAPTNEVR